jgi:hypothetical protein
VGQFAPRQQPDEATMAGDDLEQRAVHPVHDRATGLLVEVVDVLGDDRHAHVLLHVRDRPVGSVGLGHGDRVQHGMDELGQSPRPTDGRADQFPPGSELLHGEVLPESLVVTKGEDWPRGRRQAAPPGS